MKYRLRKEYSKNPDEALNEILKDRGVVDLYDFYNPSFECELDPYALDNIDLAADKLLEHLQKDSNILILVDCDVDGFTSASILWNYIKNIFPQAKLNFTLHEHKQHGLDDKIDWIEEQNFNLIICPDSASYDITEHKRLYELGIDCICLDHHEIPTDENGNEIKPDLNYAIVVNNQLSDYYTNKSLCGAGVVYKFCEVLDNICGIDLAQTFLDLAAFGEIADVMDRTNIETNYIMMEGLKNIRNKGLQVLIEAQSYSLKEKATFPYYGLTPIDIAFYIAPLINSIIRVGSMQEKEAAFYCFIEPDKELPSTKRGAKIGDIETAAEQTARIGKNAKSRQDKLKEKAIDLIDFKIQKDGLNDNNVIIVELDDKDKIKPELNGLVAMAIVNKYNKPCLIVHRNEQNLLQGSARSNNNFAEISNFKEYLSESGYFEYTAGHDAAFGAGIQASKLPSFLNYVNSNLSEDAFDKCYTVDYILDASEPDVSLLLYSLAEHPEFFGNHIDEIKVVIKNIELSSIMAMGANKDSMKISYNGIDYVRFKDMDFVDTIMNNRIDKLTVYGRANLNTFAGRTSIQVFIDDYELLKDKNKYDF